MSAQIKSAMRARLLGIAMLAPIAVVLVAAWHYGLAANLQADYRALVAGAAVLFGVLACGAQWAARHRSRHAGWWATLALCVPLAGVIVFAGWKTVAAGVVLTLAALAIGSCLREAKRAGLALVLLAGMACIAALVGWLLPFQLHHRGAYIALALLVIAIRVRALRGMLGDAATALREAIADQPTWVILLAATAGIASLGLWLPTLNYDDNAVHLILQSQLLADGYYHLDVQTQSWATAPWANNVLHAVAAMFAGLDARAAVATLWLLLGISGAWRLARALDAPPAVALAAAAVFAAQPLAGYFTTTLQVDGASAAVFLHLAATCVMPRAERAGPFLLGLVAGLLLALKTSNLVYLLPLMAWLCLSQPKGARLAWLAKFIACMLPIAAANYTYAWIVTGNPLFPFYNAVFKSPYYPPENFRDLHWMAGVTWHSLWDITFKTESVGQFYPGAAGLTVLATLPALLVDAARRPAVRWLALWAFATGLQLFWFMQYLRYIFPALAVFAVLGTVAFARVADRRVFAAAIVLLAGVDAILMPTSSWYIRGNDWSRLLREGPSAKAAIVHDFMPEQALVARVMAGDPQACVLMAEPKRPFVGAGLGRGISLHRRYDSELWRARNDAETDPGGAKWRALLARIGASHVVFDPAREPLLAKTLADQGYVVLDREGSIEVHAAANVERRRCRPEFRGGRNQARKRFH